MPGPGGAQAPHPTPSREDIAVLAVRTATGLELRADFRADALLEPTVAA